MAAYQNTYFVKGFSLINGDGTPTNITGWTLHAKIRAHTADTSSLLDLTGAGSSVIVVTNGAAGALEMRIVATDTALLPAGQVVFDVLRTDASPGPVWLFGGVIPVRTPVTRP